jgi:hypothetical protein
VMNLQESCSKHHPTTTRGCLRTVNWNLNGAEEAIEIIVSIMWALPKTRTWKMTEFGTQEPPLVLDIWQHNLSVRSRPEVYQNVFAAAIRHRWYDDDENTKFARRGLALERLQQISTRQWD